MDTSLECQASQELEAHMGARLDICLVWSQIAHMDVCKVQERNSHEVTTNGS